MAATVGRPCQGDWRPSGLTPAEASGEVLDVSDFSFFFLQFFLPFLPRLVLSPGFVLHAGTAPESIELPISFFPALRLHVGS